MIKSRIIVTFFALMLSGSAFGWTTKGHRMVALIAADRLTPEATAQVRELLGNQTMADVALYPDEIRPDHPETAPWHYVAIPGKETGYIRERDCPVIAKRSPLVEGTPWRDCAPDMILFFESQLKAPDTTREQKIVALEWLIHLFGDLHVPFHADGDGKSGNAIHVRQFGSKRCGAGRCNLHLTWDEGLIDHHGLKEAAYVAALEARISTERLGDLPIGTPAEWADESHHAAQEAILPEGGAVDQAYYEREIPVLERRLELAGVRLAAILNTIFTQ
jgi:hypothetical protein